MTVTYLDTLRTLEQALKEMDDFIYNPTPQEYASLLKEYASLLAIYRHLRDHPDQPYRGRVIPDEDLKHLMNYTAARGEGTFNDSTL